MDWKKAKIKDNNLVEIPDRWLHLYYYEAMNILFRFENSLRVFVYSVLKDELKGEWKNAAVAGGSIHSETKKRIKQSNDHGYLGHEITSPMLFLNSGELTEIIASDAYWKYFAKYFKASKSIVITKLQEIGTVRNSLAHFRPIKEDDIDLIKQNTKHVFFEIEKSLIKITSINSLVPTNNNEPWYSRLKELGDENISLLLYSCEDENWIKINFSYKMPTLVKNKLSEEFYSYKVGDLRIVEILHNHPDIKNNCIYLTDSDNYAQLNSEFDFISSKHFNIVFSKNTLQEKIDEIEASIRNLILKINEETDLLKSDNLARGALVEPKHASASIKVRSNNVRYWHASLNSTKPNTKELSEVEYWGKMDNYVTDFVSATSQYPWMPTSVSKTEPPF